jgi:hypothetical protein
MHRTLNINLDSIHCIVTYLDFQENPDQLMASSKGAEIASVLPSSFRATEYPNQSPARTFAAFRYSLVSSVPVVASFATVAPVLSGDKVGRVLDAVLQALPAEIPMTPNAVQNRAARITCAHLNRVRFGACPRTARVEQRVITVSQRDDNLAPRPCERFENPQPL